MGGGVLLPLACTFRDGSDSKSHSNLEVVNSTPQPTAPMYRVTEMADVDAPHSHADHCDHLQGWGGGYSRQHKKLESNVHLYMRLK